MIPYFCVANSLRKSHANIPLPIKVISNKTNINMINVILRGKRTAMMIASFFVMCYAILHFNIWLYYRIFYEY